MTAALSARERRYLLGPGCIGAAIVNFAINGGLGWLATKVVPVLPLWGIPGVAADLAGTAFGVTFGTCVAMAFQVRRDVRLGKLAPVALSGGLADFVARFPARTFARAVGLGLLSIPLFATPLIGTLAALGAPAMGRMAFIMVKGGFAAIEAAIVTPFIILAVLADVEASARTPAPVRI